MVDIRKLERFILEPWLAFSSVVAVNRAWSEPSGFTGVFPFSCILYYIFCQLLVFQCVLDGDSKMISQYVCHFNFLVCIPSTNRRKEGL